MKNMKVKDINLEMDNTWKLKLKLLYYIYRKNYGKNLNWHQIKELKHTNISKKKKKGELQLKIKGNYSLHLKKLN